ncbi:MAG: hypothetical protein KFH87_14430 [Bacteroidetes bacterium]|nr:hypothetical protein [Bacteroidota bacterium]
MKRFSMSILLASFCLLCCDVLFAQSEQDSATDVVPDDWVMLTGEYCSIWHPPDWAVDTSGAIGTSFVLFAPADDEDNGFRTNINLILQNVAAFNLSLDQYVELSEEQIADIVNEANLLESNRATDEQGEYHILLYTGKQQQSTLRFLQHYRLVGDFAYVLTLTCQEDEPDQYREIGERIMRTLEVHTP